MGYMTTKISNKPSTNTLKRREAKPIEKHWDIKKEILDTIKQANPKLTGDIMDHENLRKKILEAKLCKYCLEPKCRSQQLRFNQKPKCRLNLNNLDIYKTSQDKETKHQQQQEDTQPKIQENGGKDVTPERESIDIPNDDRFEEIPEEVHIDINQFIRNCKKEGPPALYNYSAQIIKRDYIMEPQPNPLQELQIKEKEKSMEKSKTEMKISQPNYKQKTMQPVKEKIIMNQKDNPRNKIIREKSHLETKLPKVSKIRMKRMKEKEKVTQLKKDNKSNN